MPYPTININDSPSFPSDLKYINRIQVLNAFLDGCSYSANDISESIGLSRQTVKKSIQFFLQNGLLVSDGKGTSTNVGGKRPELFTFTRKKYFLCTTLWPQELRLALYNVGNRLVDSLSLAVTFPDDPKAAVDNIGQLAIRLLEKNQISPKDVCAVSLSTSGIIDYKTGRLKFNSQAPAWGTNVPLKDYLQPYFADGTLIFLENAGKMTARPFLMEPEFDGKRVLVIFSGWGLSSCLIEKNHILSGKNSLIGEIGHMVINPSDPEQCGCGRRGCLERLVSPARMQSILTGLLPQFSDSMLAQYSIDKVTIPTIFQASRQQDVLARRLVDYLAATFATAFCNICLVFDPDYIIFQGDYACADDYFDSQLRKQLREFQYFPPDDPFDIRYDRRPLTEVDALGSYIALSHRYFNDTNLYQESEPM